MASIPQPRARRRAPDPAVVDKADDPDYAEVSALSSMPGPARPADGTYARLFNKSLKAENSKAIYAEDAPAWFGANASDADNDSGFGFDPAGLGAEEPFNADVYSQPEGEVPEHYGRPSAGSAAGARGIAPGTVVYSSADDLAPGSVVYASVDDLAPGEPYYANVGPAPGESRDADAGPAPGWSHYEDADPTASDSDSDTEP
jgi:hypothetical protein